VLGGGGDRRPVNPGKTKRAPLELENRAGTPTGNEATRRQRLDDVDRTARRVEEDEIEREPHRKGVDRATARKEQAGWGAVAIEKGEAEQSRAKSRRHRDLEITMQ